jgi:hypothetical protein
MDETRGSPRFDNQLRMEVVTTYEQLLHAHVLRGICFMEEHGIEAKQTVDGNDYQATHVISYVGDEPIGTARIRWFKDFAKFERSCVRRAYRTPQVVRESGLFIFDHVARKGYDKIITYASPKYARLWRQLLGFRIVEDKKPVYFSGHAEPYLKLVKELTPPPDAICPGTDANVLFRVEGFWDRPLESEMAEV